MANIIALIASFIAMFSGLLMFLDGSTLPALGLLIACVGLQVAFWLGLFDEGLL